MCCTLIFAIAVTKLSAVLIAAPPRCRFHVTSVYLQKTLYLTFLWTDLVLLLSPAPILREKLINLYFSTH